MSRWENPRVGGNISWMIGEKRKNLGKKGQMVRHYGVVTDERDQLCPRDGRSAAGQRIAAERVYDTRRAG